MDISIEKSESIDNCSSLGLDDDEKSESKSSYSNFSSLTWTFPLIDQACF